MAEHGHGADDGQPWYKKPTYIGLISVLLVIIAIMVALIATGVEPLQKGESEGVGETASAEHGAPAGAAQDTPQAGEAPTGTAAAPTADTVITRIAFGSCLDESKPLDILSAIDAKQPQLFVFMGDNVYADAGGERGPRTSPLLIAQAYATLGARPEFKSLRAHVPFLATWDDHDYGLNDAGADFEFKDTSKRAFFDFFGLPRQGERWERPDGIYDSVIYGLPGERVQIILLDTRWNRSPLKPTDEPNAPGKERFVPDTDPAKTILGEAQWAWLEQQLIEEADLRLIVSSIQVISDAHGFERWGNIPRERDRLYQLLNDTQAKNVIFLSGDRHRAGLYKTDNPLDYTLYEITSSSLNRPVSQSANPVSPEEDPARLDPLFDDANFGVIEIDWTARAAYLELYDQAGTRVKGLSVPLSAPEAVN